MIEIVKVVRVEALGDYRLRIWFSNSLEGVRDFADVIAEGGAMVGPLHEPAFFARAFVQNGVPTWPNGFAVDAIALFQEMQSAGLLTRTAVTAG
jgi:hypothetical protein